MGKHTGTISSVSVEYDTMGFTTVVLDDGFTLKISYDEDKQDHLFYTALEALTYKTNLLIDYDGDTKHIRTITYPFIT